MSDRLGDSLTRYFDVIEAEQDEIQAELDAVRRSVQELSTALGGIKAEPGPAGPRGEKGEKGETGEPGPRGERGDPGPRGEKGETGPPGKDGKPGKDGQDGVGISEATIRDGNLVLTLTDGRSIDVGRVVGEKGERGDPGPRGEKGPPGEIGPIGPRGEKGDPGPAGKDGAPGRDGRDGVPGDPGKNGKDGKDGITREEFDRALKEAKEAAAAEILASIEFDGRTWKIGDREIRTPAPEYRGVWEAETDYFPGDMVTWAGSVWHCRQETQAKPGDGAPEWTLAVKRGRDGKSA